MPSEDTKIIEFYQYQKSDKAPFIIYADFECLIEKIDGCINNLQDSFTITVGRHSPSCFSMSIISLFKSIEITIMYANVKIVWKNFVNTLESMQ